MEHMVASTVLFFEHDQTKSNLLALAGKSRWNIMHQTQISNSDEFDQVRI